MESSVRVQWADWSPKLNHLLRALLRLLSLVPLPETLASRVARIACILPSTPRLSGPRIRAALTPFLKIQLGRDTSKGSNLAPVRNLIADAIRESFGTC